MFDDNREDRNYEFYSRVVSENDVCIDVGAHRGIHTRELSKISKTVYAIEPIDFLARQIPRYPNVQVINAAASNTSTNANFAICKTLEGSGFPDLIYVDDVDEIITVPTITIDQLDLCPRYIKIDVEGAEQLVLEGAMETIRKHRPYMSVEIKTPEMFHYIKRLAARLEYQLRWDIEFPFIYDFYMMPSTDLATKLGHELPDFLL